MSILSKLKLDSADLYLLIGQGFNIAGQILLVILLPLALSQEEFIQFHLLIPITSLLIPIIFGWFTASIQRYIHDVLDPDKRNIRDSLNWYFFGSFLFLVVAYIFLYRSFDSIFTIAPLFIVAGGFKGTVLGMYMFSQKGHEFSLTHLLFASSTTIFIGICFYLNSYSLNSALLVYCSIDIAISLACWFQLKIINVKHIPILDFNIVKKYFAYGAPLMVNSVFIWIISLSDRYILKLFTGQELLAGYILSYQLGSSIITIPMSFLLAVMFPKIIALDKKEGTTAALNYNFNLLNYYFWLSIPAILIACSAAIGMKHFIYSSFILLPLTTCILVLAQVVDGTSHFYNKKFELNGRTYILTISLIIGATVNVILNFILIPIYGPIGAAIATLFAYGAKVIYVLKRN